MEITPQSFEAYSGVQVSFYTAKPTFRPKLYDVLLIIAFSSQHQVESNDLSFMNAMKLAGAELWRPSAIILDLRELHYVWGDTMAYLFQNPYPPPSSEAQKILGGGWVCPVLAIVSDACREGLTSLVQQEMLKDPSKLLFNSLEEAAAAVAVELKESNQ